MSSRRLGLCAVLLAALVVAACSSGSSTSVSGAVPDDDGELGEVLVDNTTPEGGGDPVPTPTPTPTPVPSPTPTPVPTPPPVVEGERPDPAEVLVDVRPPTAEPPPVLTETTDEPTTSGVTEDAVRVAGVVSETFGAAEIYAGMCLGAEARFAEAAAAAEPPDPPVEFTECIDDQSNPDINQRQVAVLARSRDVFAVVPLSSIAFFAEDVLAEERVPYIGIGDRPGYCGDDRSFGFGQAGAVGCPVLTADGSEALAVRVLELYSLASGADLSGLRVASVSERGIAGDIRAIAMGLEAELGDAELVYAAAEVPSPSEAERTDWSAVVASIRGADPDVVVVDGQRTLGLLRALRSSGFTGDIVASLEIDADTLRADEDLRIEVSGVYFVIRGVDTVSRSGPGWERLVAAVDAVQSVIEAPPEEADGAVADDTTEEGEAEAGEAEEGEAEEAPPPDPIDRNVVAGYAAADFFLAALADTPRPLSTEAFHDLVNGGWEYPGIDGVVCGGWWPASHVLEFPCAGLARVSPFGEPLVTAVPLTEFTVAVRPADESADN